MGGRLKAAILLLGMFILGTISGVTWDTYRLEQQSAHHILLARRVKRLKHQLRLTRAQEEAMNAIIQRAQNQTKTVHEKVSPDLAQIHADTVEAIRAILTPAQQAKFDKLHNQSHHRSSGSDLEKTTSSPATSLQTVPDNDADS